MCQLQLLLFTIDDRFLLLSTSNYFPVTVLSAPLPRSEPLLSLHPACFSTQQPPEQRRERPRCQSVSLGNRAGDCLGDLKAMRRGGNIYLCHGADLCQCALPLMNPPLTFKSQLKGRPPTAAHLMLPPTVFSVRTDGEAKEKDAV